ncbi:MAG: energy-coupling factor transporter transmembrane component T family protein [Thermoplasmata archaeon]
MSKVLTAFRYEEGDTPLHRLDPRTKLLLVASLILFLWLWRDLSVVLLTLLPLGALIAVGRLGRSLMGSLRVYALLGLILVPLNVLLHSVFTFPAGQAEVLLRLTTPGTPVLGELTLTHEALSFSLFIYARLVLMLVATSVFFLTTSLDDLEALLLSLRVPYFFVLTLSLAFRFLPTLADEGERIREAQVARGLDLESGGRLRRMWRAVMPLLFPLFVRVLRRSVRLGEALEARATFAYPTRTHAVDLVVRRGDVIVAAAVVLLLTASLVLRLVGGPA